MTVLVQAVKYSNVILPHTGGGWRIKLLDCMCFLKCTNSACSCNLLYYCDPATKKADICVLHQSNIVAESPWSKMHFPLSFTTKQPFTRPVLCHIEVSVTRLIKNPYSWVLQGSNTLYVPPCTKISKAQIQMNIFLLIFIRLVCFFIISDLRNENQCKWLWQLCLWPWLFVLFSLSTDALNLETSCLINFPVHSWNPPCRQSSVTCLSESCGLWHASISDVTSVGCK